VWMPHTFGLKTGLLFHWQLFMLLILPNGRYDKI
jgi:hypothetical protein